MTLRSMFSDPYPDNTFGVVTGTFLLSQFPDVPGKLFGLKAWGANTYPIFIGDARSTGSYPTNPRLPWEMYPGDIIGWFNADNLNQLFMAGCSGSQYLSYWVQG